MIRLAFSRRGLHPAANAQFLTSKANDNPERPNSMKPIIAIAALASLAACAPEEGNGPGAVARANPAAEYCAETGGRSEIRKGPKGETGYCHLPDGRVVDEWDLFRAAKDSA